MRKLISIVLCIISVLSIFAFSGCSWADKIEEGTYICKTPYIKFTYKLGTKTIDEIEIDGEVYKALSDIGPGNVIFFYEYQEDDVNPTDGLRTDDNETYASFYYEFNYKKHQLILTDQETGNIYHLDKVE